ncbi:acetaldehyde dehydrogenase (acetylating) [Actinokineospora globicatena]|uniref:acetaldehyde dehydrogenase (acetylating) n=1 Tax=Actinokineospora globicatena TaxID=103729 RepID=UPI0020A2EC63|nr:acetaldehyde dehydrogenase (acetylating) [Actinokineospora globicatena]MCP2303380.1 acetaldehyde dehydrogenase [Actinokineospora globicatena]GLW79486.1 acetaldehyde dehydrogenase [Actinokineospora globicatena]GLW86104.1 acetaldehyde dehydrogenase [Actinokineospora globicatena]
MSISEMATETGRGGRIRVAVIGTGAIGQDLVSKVHRSPVLDLALAVGRNAASAGLAHAARLGYPTSDGGIDAVLAAERPFDVLFDATSAAAHLEHWRLLADEPTLLVDLTPSKIGQMVVPTVTGTHGTTGRDVSLISCGGQASIPVAHALAERFAVDYLEVVSTVASTIAGRATRLNLDEYVATTQHAVTTFTDVADTKAILNISPAVPPATFRTAVHAVIPGADAGAVRAVVDEVAARVRAFAPGYQVIACAVNGDRVVVSVEVTATSDVLPPYAGNLDIINSAAILVAEQHAARLSPAGGTGARA